MPIENGAIISDSKAAARLLADYVELAQQGRLDELYRKVRDNTRNVDAHANHVIIVAVIVMAARSFAVGESSIPDILRAGPRLPERMDMNDALWKMPDLTIPTRQRSTG